MIPGSVNRTRTPAIKETEKRITPKEIGTINGKSNILNGETTMRTYRRY